MSCNILHQIISYKKRWVLEHINQLPLNIIKFQVQKSKRNFYKVLSSYKNQSIFILEYKCASPSKGIICNNPDPIKIVNIYKNYSAVISVVTDEKYFHGNFRILNQISTYITQPILCKDFFVSEWQIYYARLHRANAILLILSILDDDTYRKFTHIAHTLNMGVLTEISNENELKRAIYLNAKVIGINNRNLNNLSINLNKTINLSINIPTSIITISESGITNNNQIRKLSHYVNGFLIGTVLMSQNQLHTAINKLILGENKVCGLTRSKDAYYSYQSGAIYGGLIFVKDSPRCIDTSSATRIILSVQDLNYVGIFYNETIKFVVNIVNKLNLYAVQLHGTENQDYINTLRVQLPTTCIIWKSINMNKQLSPKLDLLHVDRYLLDNGKGSGKSFNWSNLSNINTLNQTILAGGLTINNCAQAATLGCLGLDFNSGVEIRPGIKDHKKIKKIFQILRNY